MHRVPCVYVAETSSAGGEHLVANIACRYICVSVNLALFLQAIESFQQASAFLFQWRMWRVQHRQRCTAVPEVRFTDST